jgi:signal transduction histidine kinase
MSQSLRILMIEDDEDDACLLLRELSNAGLRPTHVRVQSAEALKAALAGERWNIVFCDFTMPQFSGRKALEIVKQWDADLPFIYVSGTIAEDVAVEAMKAGAQDYVAKSDLKRLAPIVERELRAAGARRQCRQMEAERQQAFDILRAAQARLEQTHQEIIRKNQEIQTFYYILWHELNTPLTVVRELVSIPLDGVAGPLNKTQSEYLEIAREVCDQLRICINNLFDATRLDTGKLRLELKPLSLGMVVQQATAIMRLTAAEKRIDISEAIEAGLPEAPVDENRMVQIITNLLYNAIKLTPPGGIIRVRTLADPVDPRFLRVSVADSGCGIAMNQRDHLFDRPCQVKR